MTQKDCAVIDKNVDGVDYVFNVSVCDESNYLDLQAIWPSLTGMRLQWVDELDPAPGYIKPVWLGWLSTTAGWAPPEENQPNI